MASSTQEQRSGGESMQASRRPEIRTSVPSRQPLLAQLYVSMLRCRMAAERVAQLAAEGKLPTKLAFHAGLGLEATLAGVAMRLPAKDAVAPSQLSFAGEVARGAPLDLLLRGLCGAGPDIVEDPPGAALALGCAGQKKRVVVAFFDAADAGVAGWRKAVQLAGARKLPILFVMQNGSGKQEPGRKDRGAPFGEAPLITVDGTDVIAVARVARESLRCARAGYGPTVMECKIGAALQNLSSLWGGTPLHDPIRATEERLARQGIWSEAWKREVIESLEREIDHAAATAFSSQQSAFRRFVSGTDSKD